jgi:hypothetical protein
MNNFPPMSPYPGERGPGNEIRLGPDGRVAQRLPDRMMRHDDERCWITWAWPNFQLEVALLTDVDVADWTVLHRDDSP